MIALQELERMITQGYTVTLSAEMGDEDFIYTVDVRSAMRDIATAVIVTEQNAVLSEAIADAYQQSPERE